MRLLLLLVGPLHRSWWRVRQELRTRYLVERKLWVRPRWLEPALIAGSLLALIVLFFAWGRPRPALLPAQAEAPTAVSTPDESLRAAEAYLADERLADAARCYRNALLAEDLGPRALAGLNEVAARAGDTRSQRDAAAELVRRSPDDPAALNRLGVAQALAGERAAAAKSFDRALALEPDDWRVLANRAAEHARQQQWARAETLARRAVAAAGDARLPSLLLAVIQHDGGDEAAARATLADLLKRHPRDPAVRQALGQIALAEGQWDEAAAQFEAAADAGADAAPVFEFAGLARLRGGDAAAAERHYRKALSQDQHSLNARLGMGLVKDVTGQADEATREYEALLARHPDHAIACNNLAYLYAREGKQLDRALTLSERATGLAPQAASAWDTRGWVLVRAARPAEALDPLRRAVELAPQKGVIRYHLAKALLAAGDRPGGRAALREALRLGLPPAETKDARSALAAADPPAAAGTAAPP